MQILASWNVHSAHRYPAKALSSHRPRICASNNQKTDRSTPGSPLDVITSDLDYIEKAIGIDFHPALETVMDVHDQMVCTLNPVVAEQRSKELDTKLEELHQELDRAHDAIHMTEERMNTSLEHLTQVEHQVSKLKKTIPEIGTKTSIPEPVSNEKKRPKRGGIENNLELGAGLKEHWYPVAFCSKLVKECLIPLELFGEKWILFRDANGVAACVEDTCPHCLRPLSTGKVIEGHVGCRSDGLEFDRSGKCVRSPSVDFCGGVSIKSLPIEERDGMVWIWPGEEKPTVIPTCSVPPESFQIHAELEMEVPVEHGLLLENLLDLAHAPFTHTSTFAKGWPIPDAVRFHTSKLLGGNWDPYPIDMSFETPCMVVSLIGLLQPGKIERGARATSCPNHLHQFHICLPKNDRSTRLLYRMSLDFFHWTRYIPGIQAMWADIAKQVLEEDIVLVQGQQDRMLRGASVWRNPVTYDKLGIRYRQWRNAECHIERRRLAKEHKPMSAAEIFAADD